MVDVRLKLINHFVGFIPCQFACNSAFRNLVFRWESCKGSVWESVKKSSRVCTQQGLATGSRNWQVGKGGTRVKHVGELKSHISWSTTRQNFQSVQVISSWLRLATQSNRKAKSPNHFVWEKLTFRIPNTHQYIYPLYPCIVESFQREFWERNPKGKQDWLIHNLYTLILQIPLLSPSPLLHPWEVH